VIDHTVESRFAGRDEVRSMKWLGIVLAAVVAGIVFYKLNYPTYTYRYRMTVNVEVDGQMRSGSSVIEVRVSKQLVFLPSVNPLAYAVRGEAVYLALGGGRSIVALLASGEFANDTDYPRFLVSGLHFKLNLFDDRKLASLPTLGGKWELPSNELPTLVAVSDPNNSAKLKVIRPDQLEQIFGPNVHWRGVVIEMTTDPATRGLEARLPFLVSQRVALRSANQNPNTFIPSYDAFIRD
jgi:hypothetical protein